MDIYQQQLDRIAKEFEANEEQNVKARNARVRAFVPSCAYEEGDELDEGDVCTEFRLGAIGEWRDQLVIYEPRNNSYAMVTVSEGYNAYADRERAPIKDWARFQIADLPEAFDILW